mgnify:CR=1 FL=1
MTQAKPETQRPTRRRTKSKVAVLFTTPRRS